MPNQRITSETFSAMERNYDYTCCVIRYSWFHTSFIWRWALTFSRHCDNNRPPGCVWDIFTFPAGSSVNRTRRILDGISCNGLRLHLRILPFRVSTIYGRGSTHLDFTVHSMAPMHHLYCSTIRMASHVRLYHSWHNFWRSCRRHYNRKGIAINGSRPNIMKQLKGLWPSL